MMAPFAFCLIGVTVTACCLAAFVLLSVVKDKGLLQFYYQPLQTDDEVRRRGEAGCWGGGVSG